MLDQADCERWVPVRWNRRFEVSDWGRVRRIDSCGEIRQRDQKGYKYVSIGGSRTAVHRLVLEMFAGRCPEGCECAHYDGDPGNNRLENLRWATSWENTQDTIRMGRFPIGSKQGQARLTEEIVIELRRRYRKGGVTLSDLASELGVSQAIVQFAINGRTWRHVPEAPVPSGSSRNRNSYRGERHHLARLTVGDVLEMRGLFRTGDYTKRELAKKFSVHYNTVRQVLDRKTWAAV